MTRDATNCPEPPPPKRTQDSEKLAEALRANLAKRKAQQRARDQQTVDNSGQTKNTP